MLISLLLEAMEPDSPIHNQYVELHTTIRGIYARWAARDDVAPRLPSGLTPDDVGTLILAATVGLHQQWRLAPERVDLHRAYQALRHLITSALRVPPGA